MLKSGINFLKKKKNLEQKHSSKLTLKLQQIYESQKHNVFTAELNKTTLSANDDKRVESIDSVETFEYETSKDLLWKKEERKCNNIIKNYRY